MPIDYDTKVYILRDFVSSKYGNMIAGTSSSISECDVKKLSSLGLVKLKTEKLEEVVEIVNDAIDAIDTVKDVDTIDNIEESIETAKVSVKKKKAK